MSMRDRWQVDLLGRDDRVKLPALKWSDGSLEWSLFQAVPGSGQITLTLNQSAEQIDWLHDRIRITHIGEGGVRTPMGVWLLSVTGRDTSGPVTTAPVQLSDKTELLNAPVGDWYTVDAGTTVLDHVIGIVESRGGTVAAAMCPWRSTETLSNPQTWDPAEGTTWLQVINDLLGLINYQSLWADMDGNLRLTPYLLPSQRPVVGAYGERATDLLMRPQWGDEAELFAIPTGVRVFVDGDEDTEGFVGSADLPDDHPLSAVSRGREVLRVERGEATSQQVADGLAERYLSESTQVLRSVTVTHPVDSTELNDVVLHRPTGLRAAIVNRTVSMGVGAVVQDRIRHIYTSGEELPWPL